jgi:hypothetical protein
VVKRTNSNDDQLDPLSSAALVVLNLNDNRFDRPIFDHTVYNFTMYENSPLNTLIGQLNAIYISRPTSDDQQLTVANGEEDDSIRYRIVPFVDGDQLMSAQMLALAEDDVSSSFNSALPVRIDAQSGKLSVRLNVDREKFVAAENGMSGMGTNGGGGGGGIGHNGEAFGLKQGLIRFNVEASYASTSYSYAMVNKMNIFACY